MHINKSVLEVMMHPVVRIQDLQYLTTKQKIRSRICRIQDPQNLKTEQTSKIQDLQDLTTRQMLKVQDPPDPATKCQEPWPTGSDCKKCKFHENST